MTSIQMETTESSGCHNSNCPSARRKSLHHSIPSAPQRKQSTPNSRNSQLTCAELLAIGATQSTALAGFGNTFALQRFYSNLDRVDIGGGGGCVTPLLAIETISGRLFAAPG
ncbi:hypothetical protein TNCV_519601 [Trichonephila clavipes]|nr:hypothetical protein TNCV_519601 [Trichonephila clavipes]